MENLQVSHVTGVLLPLTVKKKGLLSVLSKYMIVFYETCALIIVPVTNKILDAIC